MLEQLQDSMNKEKKVDESRSYEEDARAAPSAAKGAGSGGDLEQGYGGKDKAEGADEGGSMGVLATLGPVGGDGVGGLGLRGTGAGGGGKRGGIATAGPAGAADPAPGTAIAVGNPLRRRPGREAVVPAADLLRRLAAAALPAPGALAAAPGPGARSGPVPARLHRGG
jgi:hypothetical protein